MEEWPEGGVLGPQLLWPDGSVQSSVTELLRESLAVGGYLVIGEREDLGGRAEHFVRVDRVRGIYRFDGSSPQE